MSRIRLDEEAIDLMLDQHPGAYRWFGNHKSAKHLAVVLSYPSWTVLELDGCWVMLEEVADRVMDVHWFCPGGAKLSAIREMLAFAFDRLDADALVGTTPDDHPNARAARTLNRAVGARKTSEGVYVLTRQRFEDYTRRNPTT